MPKITVGTFNTENLFLRYRLLDKERGSRFGKKVDKKQFEEGGGSILMLGVRLEEFGPISKAARRLTAKVIVENDPDILALQEVENLEALKLFNGYFLKQRYPYSILIDANDPRQIDVGLLSKYPILNVSTHQFEPEGAPVTERIFSRDCLVVEVDVRGKVLTLLVNHFKSKIGGGEEKRKRQAVRVAEILKQRFGAKYDGDFIVCGDLNAHFDAPELRSLMGANGLGAKGMVNLVPTHLDPEEHWTHYYKKGKTAEALDHMLLSPALAARNKRPAVWIERRGLGTDIKRYTGPRFAGLTGAEGASDHCPIFAELTL